MGRRVEEKWTNGEEDIKHKKRKEKKGRRDWGNRRRGRKWKERKRRKSGEE